MNTFLAIKFKKVMNIKLFFENININSNAGNINFKKNIKN